MSQEILDPTDSDAAIFESVHKKFGKAVAVDGLSLRIPRGCIYGFIGPNGAGKTTALRMLMGITRPNGGHINVLGSGRPEAVQARLGFLPEERGLYKRMRVRDYIVFFGLLKGMNRGTAAQRADEMLEKFNLANWSHEKCQCLSKGMGQKVQIIATLLHQPELVVLDEPFSGLDPINTDLVRGTILDIAHSDRTVIFSTHVMEQAEQLCHALVLINKGKVVIEGSMSEIRKGNAVRVEHNGDKSAFHELPGVAHVHYFGQSVELVLEDDCNTQILLRNLLDRTHIDKFDVTTISLHEVFVREIKRQELILAEHA